jgi:hypothetical protein
MAFRAIQMRLSTRRQLSSALAVVGGCFGVYAVLAVALHSLKNHGVVSYKPPPGTIVQYSDTSSVAPDDRPKPLPPVLPNRLASTTRSTMPTGSTETTVKEVPKKAPRKTTARQERPARNAWNQWNFASGSSRGYQPMW